MEVFILTDLKKYNITGLLAICRHNRHIFYNFNRIPRSRLENMYINLLNDNVSIMIPNFVSSNSDFIKTGNKKQVI
jgi:hypothetical protein